MSLNHVAIIMDGNRRWAKSKNLSLKDAYEHGVKNLYKTVENSIELKLNYLTVFGFSTENWSRSSKEVSFLFELFNNFLDEAISSIKSKNIKVRFIGDLCKFDSTIQEKINLLTYESQSNTSLTLTLAVNYGGMYDIVQAAKKMFISGDFENIDEINFNNYLLNKDLPKPDLLIRTGGETRLSNFMLWDLAYTELLFLPQMWPEFDFELLKYSINEYNKRIRKFGGNEF